MFQYSKTVLGGLQIIFSFNVYINVLLCASFSAFSAVKKKLFNNFNSDDSSDYGYPRTND
jgi:hypothetical protein